MADNIFHSNISDDNLFVFPFFQFKMINNNVTFSSALLIDLPQRYTKIHLLISLPIIH